jgi:hypothetical protein
MPDIYCAGGGIAPNPRPRFANVVMSTYRETALYFYNYAFGFTVLLALSLVHVVLEIPLNSLALR